MLAHEQFKQDDAEGPHIHLHGVGWGEGMGWGGGRVLYTTDWTGVPCHIPLDHRARLT